VLHANQHKLALSLACLLMKNAVVKNSAVELQQSAQQHWQHHTTHTRAHTQVFSLCVYSVQCTVCVGNLCVCALCVCECVLHCGLCCCCCYCCSQASSKELHVVQQLHMYVHTTMYIYTSLPYSPLYSIMLLVYFDLLQEVGVVIVEGSSTSSVAS
jgi:hypothetical protein